MTTSFQIEGFTLRLATTADAALARAWCEADREHAWEAGQENYWIEQKPGRVECSVLEDAMGPVFFFKIQRDYRSAGLAVEVSIQFAPDGGCARLRTMQALSKGFAWLEKRLGEGGVNAVYFNSKNRRLIQFALLRLGFKEVANEYEPSRVLGFRRFMRAL